MKISKEKYQEIKPKVTPSPHVVPVTPAYGPLLPNNNIDAKISGLQNLIQDISKQTGSSEGIAVAVSEAVSQRLKERPTQTPETNQDLSERLKSIETHLASIASRPTSFTMDVNYHPNGRTKNVIVKPMS